MKYFLAIDSDNDISWEDPEFASDGDDITDDCDVTASAWIENEAGATIAGSLVTPTYDDDNGCWRATFSSTACSSSNLVEGTIYYPTMTLVTAKDTDGVTPRVATGKKRLAVPALYGS